MLMVAWAVVNEYSQDNRCHDRVNPFDPYSPYIGKACVCTAQGQTVTFSEFFFISNFLLLKLNATIYRTFCASYNLLPA